MRRTSWDRAVLLLIVCVEAAVAGAVGAEALAAQRRTPGELAGRVLDASTGGPVADALVVLLEGEGMMGDDVLARGVTGSDGRFLLVEVPAGRHLLRIEHLGYGTHSHPLRLEGTGAGAIEITMSPTAIVLEPLVVEGGTDGSASSRNTITRAEIQAAAASGVSLGSFLGTEIRGLFMRRDAQVGGTVCVEFRGARRGDGRCRPPQVHLDGAVVPDPLGILGYHPLDGLERIRVVPPAEAGVRFGMNAGWGVILLETRRSQYAGGSDVPVVRREPGEAAAADWSMEEGPYPWARVYGAAFLGNAAGLAAGAALLSQCMDLETRRFYRNADRCGAPALLGSGIAMIVLPALGGSFSARMAGATDRSRGRLGRSLLHAVPVFIPGFAIASLDAGDGGPGGVELVGVGMLVLGAPLLNTLADRFFRELR